MKDQGVEDAVTNESDPLILDSRNAQAYNLYSTITEIIFV